MTDRTNPVRAYLGIDVGSVTTKFAVLDNDSALLARLYSRTDGQPIVAIQRGLQEMVTQLPPDVKIQSVGTTGSARQLADIIVGAAVIFP